MITTGLNDCGCCAGITTEVPVVVQNRPGLSAVPYRVGTYGEFLTSARSALSDPRLAALRSLTTRDSGDFTLALLDGWAVLADVLTFYQERIANELWLRTATERDSILRLAELIGYQLQPGVAAQTPLAFLLDETPGAPEQVTVEIGTKVQSVPGAGEKPQTFETIEPLDARVEWNALRPTLVTPPLVAAGVTTLSLKGTATNLQPGDAILMVGREREENPTAHPAKERWDLRVLRTVVPDPPSGRTQITWANGLGKNGIQPAADNVAVYAFRQRAALFGHNAPDPALVTKPGGAAVGSWSGFANAADHFDLDSAYAKIVAGSWIALQSSGGYVELYKAVTVSNPSRAAFALSGKVTRIVPDTTEHLSWFDLRDSLVFAQSERLELSSGPLLSPTAGAIAASLLREPGLLAPVEGSAITLDRRIPVLEPGRQIVVTGKPLRVRVQALSLVLVATDSPQTVSLKSGASLVLVARPTLLANRTVTWSLRTDEGFAGTVTTAVNSLVLTAAREEDAWVSEVAVVDTCAGDPSSLTLTNTLTRLLDRATVSIAANVANATHGETVTEMLGSGDATQPNQRFALKRTPLTYVPSSRASGAQSSLSIRVNDLSWHEAASLFGRQPDERIFAVSLNSDGIATVQFGDGIRGARLPSGSQNLRATYRYGTGLAGLVAAGQLSTLLTRPPGLKSAVNPLPAEGAADPESLDQARDNAPLTVLTLERVVSLEDYQDFSRAFAGIDKSLATWTWDGHTRGVFLTVAGPRGATVSAASAQKLIEAIRLSGDPFVPLRVASYAPAYFQLSAQVAIDPDFETAVVVAAVAQTLRDRFSFEHREFGERVASSEVIATMQSVSGVMAVNLKRLHRRGSAPALKAWLDAELPHGGDATTLRPAELLTIDPSLVVLEVMP